MIWDLLLATLTGAALGASLLFWWTHKHTHTRRRIPKEWPLKIRPLVNSKEQRVWVWLNKVMFDHQVLIKLPVTRFTAPLPSENAIHWYQLLNGVYCTFTVCDMQGKVLGCLDLQAPQGRNASNQALKQSLLSQCGIRYWVVNPSRLPSLPQIRSGLLGEEAVQGNEREQLEMRFNGVRDNLQAAVTRQRENKSSPAARAEASLHAPVEFSDSRLASGWELNSFVTPMDSRTDTLQK